MGAENPSMTLDPKYDHYDYPTTSPNKQSGHPGHLTPEQEAQVHQLRAMLEQEGYSERLDTLTLLRFLRARKFNVELTKKMFVEAEAWRKNMRGKPVDELVREFVYVEKPKVFEYYPQYYHKTDKDGRPVYIEKLGKIDLPSLYKITTEDRMLQNLVVEYEKVADPRLPACSRKSGSLLETCCTIMDLSGVGIGKVSSVYGYVQQASVISQNYYPERLGKLYLINAPWGFSSVFAFVKRFLDPVTVQKIHVLGSGYQAELLGQIDPENLPKEFGGTCECEGGCAFSDMGPWQDPKWAKPPKWAQADKKKEAEKDKDTTIQNPPPPYKETSGLEGSAGANGVRPAVADTEEAGQDAALEHAKS
ncbi:MAG: cytosolic factor, phosphatidylinositol/phosphatidylcholine transfer protein [Trizodia sp. TS-e1964]|nr:MAG: cytosolic factor, phosphatidylinositol/phosphatidylcholine transfer protein [Trizodia sp. TS-e1964]